ncbi:hypothetical protein D1872_227700 [compost metagenome]
MRNSGGKVPKVSHAYIGYKIPPVLIDRRDPGPAHQHDGPFRLLMPMQFPDAPRRKRHVHPGQRRRGRKLANGHLPRPAAVIQLHMRIGE